MIQKLNKILNIIDVKLVRASSSRLDSVPYTNNLLELISSTVGTDFVTSMPIEKLRIFSGLGVKLSSDVNIWTKSLQLASMHADMCRPAIFDEYYSKFQPQNISDFLGVRFPQDHSLSNFKPYEIPMPWLNINWSTYRHKHYASILKEIKIYDKNINLFPGWAACGPLSEQKMAFEWDRLARTYKSIQALGYQRSDHDDGDISGFVMIDNSNENWCFMITQGGHRACCLAALGYHDVTVRISSKRNFLDGLQAVKRNYENNVTPLSPDEISDVITRITRGEATEYWQASVGNLFC